jgi:hypothetical protein
MASRYRGYDGHTVERLTETGWEALPLEPSISRRNHSPTGFSWGYNGSGPTQLALALLLDVAGREGEDLALAWYREFRWDTVSRWPMDDSWEIGASEIRAWLETKYSGVLSRGGSITDAGRTRLA